MSSFRDLAARFGDKNAQVLGVSMDDLDAQKKYKESLKLPYPLLADPKGEAAEAYGVKGMMYASRTTFVIDGDGKIVKVVEGKDAIDPGSALDACPLHKKAG